ncbi:hypothetical protein H312_00568, partial [Anncaliia algerae PRA339]
KYNLFLNYNNELEEIDKDLSFPDISFFVLNDGKRIFEKFLLSTNGIGFKILFIDYAEICNDLGKVHREILSISQYLHKKLVKKNFTGLRAHERSLFNLFDHLRNKLSEFGYLSIKLTKKHDCLLHLFEDFLKEWSDLPNNKKYYIIRGYEHPRSEIIEKSYIFSLLKNLGTQIQNLEKSINKDMQEYLDVSTMELNHEKLRKLILMAFNMQLLLCKEWKLTHFFYEKIKLLFKNSNYSEIANDFLIKIENYLMPIRKYYEEKRNNQDFKNFDNLIWRRINLEFETHIDTFKETLESCLKKSEEINIKSYQAMINLLMTDFIVDETEAMDILKDFRENNFNIKKFSKRRIKYYSLISYFLSNDFVTYVLAHKNMFIKLKRQLYIPSRFSSSISNNIDLRSKNISQELHILSKLNIESLVNFNAPNN